MNYVNYRDQAIAELKREFPSCLGFPDCDGDLPGEEHSDQCPRKGKPERDWKMILLDERAKAIEAREALKNLAAKMHEIEVHPSFKNVFTMAHVHGFAYNGPNWGEELKAADQLLETTLEASTK